MNKLLTAAGLAAALSALFTAPVALSDVDAAGHSIPVSDAEFGRVLRPVTWDKLIENKLNTGIYHGSPTVLEKQDWYEKNFYTTLASRKVWEPGTGPRTHDAGDPITWSIVPIPQYAPPPCSEPQPTGYDAEGCRIANVVADQEGLTDEQREVVRNTVRRGRDVWFKGTFGNQDLNEIHLARTTDYENMWYPWLDTRVRKHRYTKWGFMNSPDCTEGDESSYWLDKCQDTHDSGVLGYRKYFKEPEVDEAGNVVYNPRTAPYEEGELQANRRFAIGHPCVQCHVGFDPTRPPANPNEPEWENLMGLIGNQHINQPDSAFLQGLPTNFFARQVAGSARPGTVDTSLNPNDFIHNPGTQNNITDFINRRTFVHKMKHPVTGEIKEARTQHILKGGEDTVGDRLALLRVYINIGMCTEECWVPNFPVPGTFFGEDAAQKPQRVKQCYQDCEAWNHADAKMPDLAFYAMSGGPTYLLDAQDVDGTPGAAHVDVSKAPAGRKVFTRECASCHSTKVPPASITGDKDALEKFYDGHVFGNERYWQLEFDAQTQADPAWQAKHLVDGKPRQFAEKGMFGQDWLGNDELTPVDVVGTNRCRAMHTNHNVGQIWEDYASLTFWERTSPGTEARVINPLFPLIGGKEAGTQEIGGGGPGYYRNISLLSIWAISPFLHNNAIGELTYLPDGGIDYTVAGRIAQFENAFEELMMSDDPEVTPHREPKITRFTEDFKLATRTDGKGFIKLPVEKGTPVADVGSINPHSPLYKNCSDMVENKGHQFGVDLSADEKLALREFLKLM